MQMIGLCRLPTAASPRRERQVQGVPLRGVRVEARLVGGGARLRVEQRYHNAEATPIEAVYTFPLDADAAVCGFSARLGDRTVVGEVDEREAAFARYDDAMAAGHAAMLLDQERPDVFTASLGNLRAGEEAVLTLDLVQPLRREGPAWRFTLPTTVAPRYVPATDTEPGAPTSEVLNPPRQGEVPYGLTFRARIDGAVRRVESPSHPIRTELHDDHVIVELSQDAAVMDRDLVLLVEPRVQEFAAARVEAGPGGARYLGVEWVVPDAPADRAPREVVFVVDCSGSMDGREIAEARSALALCLRALEPGDRFDLIRFGSTHAACFGEPRAYDEASAAEALRAIEALRADMGGTEVLGALQAAVGGGRRRGSAQGRARPTAESASGDAPGVRRDVLLLTDGQVGNERDVLALAEAHKGAVRISTFGIGYAAGSTLVRGLAEVTGGFTAAIHPGERIEAKVLRTFGLLRAAPLPFSVTAAGESAGVLPSVVYGGELIRAWFRLSGEEAEGVTLVAGEHRRTVPVEAVSGEPVIPVLWGRERIRTLEQGTGRRGSAQRRAASGDRQVAELVAIGKQFGLVSSVTSYVGVITVQDGVALPPAELRRVPLVPPPGEPTDAMVASAPPVIRVSPMRMSAPPTMSAPAAMSPPPARRGPMSPPALSEALASASEPDYEDLDPWDLPRARSAPVADPLFDLLASQRVDGHFEPSVALRALVGTAFVEAERLAVSHAGVWTRLALVVLERRFADRADEWRAAAGKARRALGSAPADPVVQALLDAVRPGP